MNIRYHETCTCQHVFLPLSIQDDVESQSSIDDDTEEDVDLNEESPASTSSSKRRTGVVQSQSTHQKGMTKRQKMEEAMVSASQSLRSIASQESSAGTVEQDDDVSLFGKIVAVELRKIKSARSRNQIKMKVQQMLFDAQEKEEEELIHPSTNRASSSPFPQHMSPYAGEIRTNSYDTKF